MNKRNELFEKLCSHILDKSDRFLAEFVYDFICEEIYDEQKNCDKTCSVSSIEATMETFESVVNQFKRLKEEREIFLVNFQELSKVFERNNKLLEKCIDSIPNSTITPISNIVNTPGVATGGALFLSSLLFPPAAAAIALAGGMALVGGIGLAVHDQVARKEFDLLMNILAEAKKLIKEELEAFLPMYKFFSCLEELEKSIKVLIDYNVLKEMSLDVYKFFIRTKYQTNIKVGEYKDGLKKMLKFFLMNMKKNGRLKIGNKTTPVTITFLFVVCLMNDQNRLVLECIMLLPRLNRLATQATNSTAESVSKSILEVGCQKSFKLTFNNATKFLAIKPSFESYKPDQLDIRQKIYAVMDEFCYYFPVIKSIYSMFKEYESVANIDESPLTTIILKSVPVDATEEDIKMAIKPLLPKEAWVGIKLQRLSTKGNNWLVQVSTFHSKKLFGQSSLVIKNQKCLVDH